MTTENDITDPNAEPVEPVQPSIFDGMEINPVTNEVVLPTVAPVEEPVTEEPESPEPTPELEPFKVPDDAQVPTQEPSSGLSDQERRHYEHLLRTNTEVQQAQTSIQQNQALADLQKGYEAEGYDESTSAKFARIYLDANQKADTKISKALGDQQEAQAQLQTAQVIGQQYGVDPKALENIGTWQDMQRYALLLKSNGDMRSEFEKRLSSLEANKIEDGPYDTGGDGSSPMNAAQILFKSGSDPNFEPTPEQNALVSKHLGLNT